MAIVLTIAGHRYTYANWCVFLALVITTLITSLKLLDPSDLKFDPAQPDSPERRTYSEWGAATEMLATLFQV